MNTKLPGRLFSVCTPSYMGVCSVNVHRVTWVFVQWMYTELPGCLFSECTPGCLFSECTSYLGVCSVNVHRVTWVFVQWSECTPSYPGCLFSECTQSYLGVCSVNVHQVTLGVCSIKSFSFFSSENTPILGTKRMRYESSEIFCWRRRHRPHERWEMGMWLRVHYWLRLYY